MVEGKRKLLSTIITIGAVMGTMILGDKMDIDKELVRFAMGVMAGSDALLIGGNLISKKLNNGGKNNE